MVGKGMWTRGPQSTLVMTGGNKGVAIEVESRDGRNFNKEVSRTFCLVTNHWLILGECKVIETKKNRKWEGGIWNYFQGDRVNDDTINRNSAGTDISW